MTPTSVQVSVDTSRLPPERRQAWEREGGTERLVAAIHAELSDREDPKAAPPDELRITVDDFRLSSRALAFWFGVAAGAAILEVQTEVVSGGEVVKVYRVGAGSSVGGFKSRERVHRLTRKVAAEIVERM